MRYKILIPQEIAQEGKDYLIEHGYEIKMGSGISAEAIKHDVIDCDAILARTAPFTAEVMEAAPKLKVISRYGVGVDNIDVAAAERMGIWVLSTQKANAYFINVARGALVFEEELIDALNKKVIAGAAIDVFEEEPPKRDNPLLSMDNVIATPHNAGITKECHIRMSIHAAMGIDEVLTGKIPSWPVNKPVSPRK